MHLWTLDNKLLLCFERFVACYEFIGNNRVLKHFFTVDSLFHFTSEQLAYFNSLLCSSLFFVDNYTCFLTRLYILCMVIGFRAYGNERKAKGNGRRAVNSE